MIQIIPTVFEKDFEQARKRLADIEDSSRWIQIDVTDGVFTYGRTFDLELINKVERGEKKLWDIHLMVKEPIKWFEKCMFMGATRIIGQVEMMDNRDDFVSKVKSEAMEVGLAFDVGTKVENIPEEVDLVLLMARKAGFEEKEVDNGIFEKIEKAKKMNLTVAVDGGVDESNIFLFEKAGVDIVYCGSHYFEVKNAVERRN